MQTMQKTSGMMPPPEMGAGGAGAGMAPQGGPQGGPPPEGDMDSQFERTFADLAFAQLKDKAPKLLDSMVGFQVIERDEDTRAVGVFGFEASKKWLYAPVFFLNGELKGYELLYIKDQDSFVPLEENWVNYILNRKAPALGEGTPYNYTDLATGQPDLSVFSRSPLSFSKYSSAGMNLSSHYREGDPFDLDITRSWFVLSPNGETFKKTAARADMPEVFRQLGKPMVDVMLRTMRQDEKFASAVLQFYDIHDLLVSDFEKTAATIMSEEGKCCVNPDTQSTDSEQIPEVEIIRIDDPLKTTERHLNDDERAKLVTDGVVIRDHRDGTSKVYNLIEPTAVMNPSDPGLYELLVQPGAFRKAIILTKPLTIGSGVANCCVCVDKETKKWVNASTAGLYIRNGAENKEWEDFYDGLSEVSSVKTGESYIIVGPKGESTLPFEVKHVVGNEDGSDLWVDVREHVDHVETLTPSSMTASTDRGSLRPSIDHTYDTVKVEYRTRSKGDNDDGWADYDYCRHIAVSDTENGTLGNVGNTLLCPSKLKVIPIKGRYSDLGYTPGTLADVQMALIKSGAVHSLRLWSDGTHFQVQTKEAGSLSTPLRPMDTLTTLIQAHGMSEFDARGIMKTATDKGRGDYLVKYAGNLLPGPDAPAIDMNGIQGYDGRLGAAVLEPSFRAMPVPRSYDGNRQMYDPLDTNTKQMATDAAQSGQKEVFDTAVLSGLVKKMDLDSVIDKYLGDLIIGLDRIGRLLFMFYWHQDKFKDRYGQQELRELEDSLKSTFSSVGDVVLFLKKRSVEPDAVSQGTDVDLED